MQVFLFERKDKYTEYILECLGSCCRFPDSRVIHTFPKEALFGDKHFDVCYTFQSDDSMDQVHIIVVLATIIIESVTCFVNNSVIKFNK